MAFSSLFQFIPGDQQGLGTWLLAHYLDHQEFYKALLGRAPSIPTTNYPIQRMDDPDTWLAAHQEMSQSVWSGLGGGQSENFGKLDWRNPTEVQDWMYAHYLWHKTVRESLGL